MLSKLKRSFLAKQNLKLNFNFYGNAVSVHSMLKHLYHNLRQSDVDQKVMEDEKEVDGDETVLLMVKKAFDSETQVDITNIVPTHLTSPELESSLSRLNQIRLLLHEDTHVTKFYQSQAIFLLIKALCKKCIKNGNYTPNFLIQQHIYQAIFHNVMVGWNDCNMNDEKNRKLFQDKLQNIPHVNEFPSFIEAFAEYFQSRMDCINNYKNRYDLPNHGKLFATCLIFTNFIYSTPQSSMITKETVSYWQKITQFVLIRLCVMIAILRKIDLPQNVVSAINAMSKEEIESEKENKTSDNDSDDDAPPTRSNTATACLKLKEIVKKYKSLSPKHDSIDTYDSLAVECNDIMLDDLEVPTVPATWTQNLISDIAAANIIPKNYKDDSDNGTIKIHQSDNDNCQIRLKIYWFSRFLNHKFNKYTYICHD